MMSVSNIFIHLEYLKNLQVRVNLTTYQLMLAYLMFNIDGKDHNELIFRNTQVSFTARLENVGHGLNVYPRQKKCWTLV